MNTTDTATEIPAARPLFPELDTGLCMLAFYIRQYIQSLHQLEKRPIKR